MVFAQNQVLLKYLLSFTKQFTMKRIFYADDDADDRDLFDTIVKDLSEQSDIITADDGEQLMARIEDNTPPPPDVIFLDINMPHKNGFDALDDIRKHPKTKNTPVIILTTSAREEDINTMYDKGANFFITKPDSFSTFRNILKSLFTNPQMLSMRSKGSFVLNSLF